jgi:cysteine-rich repeat protein
LCGDEHRAAGEQCDDGNLTDGDGCSSDCKTEYDCTGYVNDASGDYTAWSDFPPEYYKAYDYDGNGTLDYTCVNDSCSPSPLWHFDLEFVRCSEHFCAHWDQEDLDGIIANGDDPNEYLNDEDVDR